LRSSSDRKRLTYANVMATIAVFLLLGGASAFAATQLGKNSVGARQLRKDAVTSPKVKDGSLNTDDFAAEQLPVGPAGAPGAAGPRGPQGPPGIGGLEVFSEETATNSTSAKRLEIECPEAKVVIGASFDIDGAESGADPNQFKEATIDGVDLSNDFGVAFFEAYEQKGGTSAQWSLKGRVVCAAVQ
jgi:hypothetical protein